MGITVPRVTLTADFGAKKSFGELNISSIGYGLHQTWIYAAMFSPSLFGGDFLLAPYSDMPLLYVVSIFVYGLMLIGYAAFDTKVPSWVASRPSLVISALLASAGTLVAVLDLPNAFACSVVAGVLTGIGSSGLLLAWGIEFARKERTTTALNTGVALVLAMFVYAIVLHYVPTPVASGIVVAIPLVELALLLWIRSKPYVEKDFPIFHFAPLKRAKFFAVFAIPVGVFGFALGVLRQSSMRDVIPAFSSQMQFAVVCAAAVAALLIIVTVIALEDTRSWSRNFRIIVPVVALAALFIPSSISGSAGIWSAVLLTGYLCLEALLWSFFGEFSQEFNLSPVFVFGLGRGVSALTALVGTYVLSPGNALFASLSMGEIGITVFVLFVTVLAYALLPDERDVRKAVIPCPVVNFELDADELALAGQMTSAPEGGVQAEAAPTQSAAPSMQEVPAAAPELSTGQTGGSQVQGDAEPEGGEERKQGWFKENCEIISNRYLLSRRETEVLFLLAKGHNSAYIQEKLYISEGTAKTHTRHIYRKLDVHSQQELMRMVEEADKLGDVPQEQ